MTPRYSSLAEIQKDLGSGSITLPELVRYYLQQIELKRHLNAFVEVFAEEALQRAEELQKKWDSGERGKLIGMVVGLKDNLCFKDHQVTASSKILEGFTSLYTGTAVQRLLDEDAIMIGRLSCDEFAMGSSNEKSVYGPVLNPVNEKCVPGGSSGGSAAAVAADLCLATLGSDTGGSIRQPAAYTNIVGLKPTYGRISRYGLIAYASSFDQIGPMTHQIEDSFLMLEVMSGPDGMDGTLYASGYQKESIPASHMKIAVLKDCLHREGLNSEIKLRFLNLIEKLKESGHTVEEVNFPYVDQLVPAYYVLTTAEASSNLSRFDGIHYGYRAKDAKGIEATYKQSRTEGFGTEVKRRIMLGTFVLSSGYYDAYYSRAQKVRRVIQNKTNEVLSQYDVIITPTTADTAFEMGKKSADPVAMYLEDIFTVQANLTGHPAISIPLGKKENGMPFALQILAPAFQENQLLQAAKQMEQCISGF
ncbi:MAG: Asp-tRNA(Asn)/Glu-tRNA(Gln) amidotransferase subunit GatA [Bacteroidetes bacterium]|nr:Asp-tRNA(Asn)/Glu-tRNA(Gln) amidotransferase subunit GatA [Bacteroidota bacterium]